LGIGLRTSDQAATLIEFQRVGAPPQLESGKHPACLASSSAGTFLALGMISGQIRTPPSKQIRRHFFSLEPLLCLYAAAAHRRFLFST
jgi:hypothetical protein